VWRKLRKQVAVERELLRQHLEDHAPLIHKCRSSAPDRIELSALGAMLLSFYNGIENIFKRVTVELGQDLPQAEAWHKDLLERMTREGPGRPAVISSELAQSLEDYLRFRHFFRSAYSFQVEWERMSNLVAEAQDVLCRLETELDAFLKATEGQH
jgi:hypothetical protein